MTINLTLELFDHPNLKALLEHKATKLRKAAGLTTSEYAELKNTDKLIHSAILQLMIENGWSKSCLIDVLSIADGKENPPGSFTDIDDFYWEAVAEVRHEKTKKVLVKGVYLKDSVQIESWEYIK